MPLYTVTTQAGALSDKAEARLAGRGHAPATGLPN